MVKTIIFDEDAKFQLNELMQILKELEGVQWEEIKLYSDSHNVWFFDEEDNCYIWDGSKFKEGTECKECGTYNLIGEKCEDCLGEDE